MAEAATPRQKMINLMYLVFIAMLAMNMGKKVLSSFGFLNEKLEYEHTISENQIVGTMRSIAQKAKEQPLAYKEIYQKSAGITAVSDTLFNHIQNIKSVLYEGMDEEKRKDYESMDSESKGDEYFFGPGPNGYSKKGEAFVKAIETYKSSFVKVLGKDSKAYQSIQKSFEEAFDIADVETEDGGKQHWLKNRYEGFPLIATLVNLSVLQRDVRFYQKEVYAALTGNQLKADASVNERTYQSIVIPDKPTYFEGEQFSGKVVLGRYDETLLPKKLVINGREYRSKKGGAAVIKFRTRGVGENPIKGFFYFMQDGKEIKIPVNSSYVVVSKPKSAVISADKMNVLYRGVDNPITVSMPGVTDDNLKVTAGGIRKLRGIGKYSIRPVGGKEAKIDVVGTTSDGTRIKSTVRFRIKEIPSPVASIRNEYGTMQIPLSGLKKSVVQAQLVDFDFDLKIRVNSFKLKVPGQATVLVKGNRMDDKAERALNRAKRGDVITIFDVKTNIIGNAKYKLKKTLPLNVEINN